MFFLATINFNNNQYYIYSLKDPSKIPSGLTNTSSPSIESNQQNSNAIENSPPNEEKMYIPYPISEIVDMKFVCGEQYAKVSFEGIYFGK